MKTIKIPEKWCGIRWALRPNACCNFIHHEDDGPMCWCDLYQKGWSQELEDDEQAGDETPIIKPPFCKTIEVTVRERIEI